MIPVRKKRPAEARTLGFGFDEKLPTGDSVISLVSTSISSPATISAGALASNRVTARVSGGSAGNDYLAQVRVATAQGELLDLDVTIEVLDLLGLPLQKQTTETRTVTFDFSPSLIPGDTVSAISVVSGGGLTLASQGISGNTANVQVSGGVDGTNYTVTMRVTTTLGDTLELARVVEVRNDEN